MEADPDALRAIKNLERRMTLAEYMEFRTQDEFLWLQLRATGYEDPEAWAQVIERGTNRRAEAWTIAKEMATSIMRDEWDARGHEYRQSDLDAVAERLAEQLMVEQHITPPTFTKWIECETCGRMPVPERVQEQHAANCPWCLPGGEI